MIIIAVVMSCIKVYTQIQDQRKFYRVFKQILKEKTDHMKADYLLFLFDCFVNVILSILTVFLTFSLISRSDKVTDLVLNCLTITFIVEFEPPGPECTSKQSCNSDGADKPQLVEKFLTSADYSSDPTSINKNSEVLKTVKNYIQNSKLLPVLNSCFRHDPHPGKPKFLVLQFNVQGKAITINVREKLVADFTVMEQILSRNLVKDGTAIPTPNKRRQQNNQSWCCFVIQSFFVVVSILTVMWLFFGSIVNDFLPKYDWQRESGGSGSDIRLTWIHDYEPMSKSNLEAQVTSAFLPTTDNHTTTTSTAIENVLVTISGEKNSMKLMTEFGFLPAIAVAGSNLTAAQILDIGKAEGGDGICAGAVMMLSNKFWFFDNSTIDSQTKPFRFAGGCILPPYDLVLKYQKVNQQTYLEIEKKEAEGDKEAGTCGHLSAVDGIK
eukprot:gene31508-40916_t